MPWRDAASVRIKFKVPATQRHHRKRAARARWLAISEVRFLYGLSTYKFMGGGLSATVNISVGNNAACSIVYFLQSNKSHVIAQLDAIAAYLVNKI